MAETNVEVNVNPLDWATTDQGYIPDDGAIWYYREDTGNVFYLVGDGTSTVLDLRGAGGTDGVDQYLSTIEYGIGDLIEDDEMQYVSPMATNKDNTPFDTIGENWLSIPSYKSLMGSASAGTVFQGMEYISDRQDARYQQVINWGKYRRGQTGNFATFKRCHLDGTIITGNATLEALVGIASGKLWAYIDKYAPDELGVRAFKDLGDYILTPQSSGGDADEMAELVHDQFQGHRLNPDTSVTSAGGDIRSYTLASKTIAGVVYNDSNVNQTMATDGINGTPRTGSTTHGRRFTTGCAYVIIKS